MKVLKTTGASTSPWYTLLVSGIQVDFVMLITILRDQHFSFQSAFKSKAL